ncbi:hypothetical protein MTR_5g032330 [Medicago truncatula]|uniref:Uncharacterized protein n=1 Tax=Medicago truncatula TaxID=3880 RepID=G7JXP2_MEDTR|nr:hypothetical protein MTR_5g032330 [Medicago truncatula]
MGPLLEGLKFTNTKKNLSTVQKAKEKSEEYTFGQSRSMVEDMWEINSMVMKLVAAMTS